MSTTYTYSYINDFSSNFAQYQFHSEIVAESGITPNLLQVDMGEDEIKVIFESVLSEGEEIILNNLVSEHVPVLIGSKIANIHIHNQETTTSIYEVKTSFSFPGTIYWRNPSHIQVISVMDTGGTSYDVKIYNVTNNNQIAITNLNNTEEMINDLGTLSNLPESPAIFEVHAKVNGNTVALIKNIHIYHD